MRRKNWRFCFVVIRKVETGDRFCIGAAAAAKAVQCHGHTSTLERISLAGQLIIFSLFSIINSERISAWPEMYEEMTCCALAATVHYVHWKAIERRTALAHECMHTWLQATRRQCP